LLDKPRQCKNGHLFCLACILQSLEKNYECPQCRCSLKQEELARSLFVERHIRLLKIYCRYHFATSDDRNWFVDEDGCNETFTLETVQKHENECGYVPVHCQFSSSCTKLRKFNVEIHEKNCVFRPETCQHCKVDVQRNNMEEHMKSCGMVPVECTRCHEIVKRSELEKHRSNSCPDEEIPCQFHDMGCPKRLIRKDLAEHLREDFVDHMSLMKKGYDDQLAHIKQEYDLQLRLKEDRIRHLEKCSRDNETKVEWKVKNYNQVRKKSYIQSEKFSIAGFSWFIGFYTDGDNSESRGFISIYLFLDVSHIPKGKSITLEYFLRFVNHKDPLESVKKEFKTTFPIKGGQGWGDRKALRNNILEQGGFLKEDTLTVEAEVTVKKIGWSV